MSEKDRQLKFMADAIAASQMPLMSGGSVQRGHRPIIQASFKCKKCGAICDKREVIMHLNIAHGMRVKKKWRDWYE